MHEAHLPISGPLVRGYLVGHRLVLFAPGRAIGMITPILGHSEGEGRSDNRAEKHGKDDRAEDEPLWPQRGRGPTNGCGEVFFFIHDHMRGLSDGVGHGLNVRHFPTCALLLAVHVGTPA